MKSATHIATALCLVLAGCAGTAPQAPPATPGLDRTVLVVNQTGQTIWRFYGSNVNRASWEEDILGPNILPDGVGVNINFDDGSTVCNFDLRAEFQDGTSIVQDNVDLCAATEVIIR